MNNKKISILGVSLQLKHWVFFAGILLAFLAYFGGLAELVNRWNTQEEYGHGYFIPLISLWFLWKRKGALIQSEGTPSWHGVLLIVAGALGLLLGEFTAIFVLIQFGFIMTLIGLVLAFGGYSLLKVSILPILVLVFAIPLPYFIDAQLSWRLQILSSQLGVEILRLFGVAVFLEGNVIDLGIYKLQVVEACSGLRYLYPLLSIGFFMAYMYKAALWKRVVIFLSAIPITVLMNSVRIAVVGMLVNKWGIDQAEGFAHYFEGWIIFMVCLFILVAEVMLFEKYGQKRDFNSAVDIPEIKPVISGKAKAAILPVIAATLFILAAGIFAKTVGDRQEIIPERESLVTFPHKISEWKAKQLSLDEGSVEKLQLTDYVLANYSKEDKKPVNFYIAYYASQRKGVSPHSPQVCMPGGGWIISSLNRITLDVAGKKDFHVNRTIINKGSHKQVVYYWFEQRGRHIANEYLMKWYLLLDSIKKNRTDGALVRVTTYLRPDESEQNADARIVSFLEDSVPEINKYVPE